MMMSRAAVLLAAGFCATLTLSACGADMQGQDVTETGQLRASLSAAGSTGVVYRLRNALFHVFNGSQEVQISSEAHLAEDTATVQLATGSYMVTLDLGWGVERLDAASGVSSPVQAALVSANPTSVQIVANQTTPLVYGFDVAGQSIVFGDGQLQLRVSFDDTPAENTGTRCADGLDNDSDGAADCADPDCAGFCSMASEAAGMGCSDGVDNDADGLVDCQDSDCTSGGFCNSTATSLLITEIMYNPAVVADATGEWFEIENTASLGATLDGCVISTPGNGASFVVPPGTFVSGSGFAVVARSGDPMQNAGIPVTVIWPGLILGNSGGEIQIACNGALLDDVSYDLISYPLANGASLQLSNGLLANDDPTGWCLSTIAFGMGDLGSPRASNDICP